jgi:hypothetical protein
VSVDALVGDHLLRLVALSRFEVRLVDIYRRSTAEQQAKLDAHEMRLVQHVRAEGRDEASSPLRRMACVVPGAMRGLQDWLSCLDDNRGGFSSQRLSEATDWLERVGRCVNATRRITDARQAQLAAAASIRPERALREMADDELVSWLGALEPTARQDGEAGAGAYAGLTIEDVDVLFSFALELMDTLPWAAEDVPSDILRPLALLRSEGLAGKHHALLDRSIHYPGELFRGADALAARRLFTELESDSVNRDHVLKALAWIGNDGVRIRFAEWRTSPPTWRSSLHLDPHDYAKEAGWTLDGAGRRRDLYLPVCYPLVAATDTPLASNAAVRTLTAREDRCPWCNGPLCDLLDLDLRDPAIRLLGLRGERLRIPSCVRCTCYATTYFEVDTRGNASWLQGQVRPEHLDTQSEYAAPAARPLAIGPARPTPFAGDCQLTGSDRSQLGGHPCWLQDADYPACPRCGDVMLNAGQVAGRDIHDMGEGITYAFLCRGCGVAATSYQRT